MNRKLLSVLGVLALALSLSACAGNSVQELETSLMMAQSTATVYVKLPPCSETSTKACSKYAIVKTINDSRAAAKVAVVAARDAKSDAEAANMLGVAQTATTAFLDIINSDAVQSAIKGE